MKKWLGILVLGCVFVLAGCKSYVTSEDLKTNDWLVEASKEEKEDGTPDMIVSFSDHVMSIKVDTSSLESSAEDGWEALGEEIGKQLVEQMNFKFEYEVTKDELKLTDTEDSDKEIYYKVTKDDDNVIFTPDKEKNTDEDEGSKMVLQPYKKTKTKTSSTTTSSSTVETTTSSTKEKEVASTDDYIKKFEDKSLVVYNKRKMTKDDFGMAPMTAKDAAMFSLIETDNEDEQKNARILIFDNLDDLNATKAYYDDLGKSSAALFSYTAVDEDNLVLMQFNGGLDQSLVEQYTKEAALELTEPPFETSTSSESYTTETSNTEEYSAPVISETSTANGNTVDNQADTDQFDNETANTDGTTTNADGTTTNADGTTTNADGTITNADGSVTNADGTTTNADGTTTNADGTITNPDGTITNADGTTVNVDGSTTNSDGADQGQTSGDTTTVLAGEGLNQIAARVGVSIDTLYELNGIDPNNFLLVPGQELRIR